MYVCKKPKEGIKFLKKKIIIIKGKKAKLK